MIIIILHGNLAKRFSLTRPTSEVRQQRQTRPTSMTQHSLAHVYGGRAGMFCVWCRFDRHGQCLAHARHSCCRATVGAVRGGPRKNRALFWFVAEELTHGIVPDRGWRHGVRMNAEQDFDPQRLVEGVGEQLVGDADPTRIDGFRFASRIMPAYRLLHALFYVSELDATLKLMVLHELTRAGGRSTLERIRGLCRFFESERVEAHVRSLREAGWLELRETDHTYAVSAVGIHLLSVLHAADVGNLDSSNAIARAAQNAQFGATLDGADPDASAYLLDQLLVLLDNQVEEARLVLQQGRPRRLIEWSRRDQPRQLEIIQGVLRTLQERVDPGSRAFTQIVRLHRAMQEIVLQHNGVLARLREWNLERLHTVEAGYSIPELCEAVLGAAEESLEYIVSEHILSLPAYPPNLVFGEVKERLHGARRKLATQREDVPYAPPTISSFGPLSPADVDPAEALRARLSALLEQTSGEAPMEVEQWVTLETFAMATFDVATLARLQAGMTTLHLEKGRIANVESANPMPRDVDADKLLAWFVENEALRVADGMHLPRVRISLSKERGDE